MAAVVENPPGYYPDLVYDSDNTEEFNSLEKKDLETTDGKISSFKKFIIFLDIDYVLYHKLNNIVKAKWKAEELFGKKDKYSKTELREAAVEYFDKIALSNLHSLIDTLSLKGKVGIVISSSWRRMRTVEKMKEMFSIHRFSNYIVDKTDGKEGFVDQWNMTYRPGQIRQWLKEHPSIVDYVIFDDKDEGLKKEFGDRFIQVPKPHLLTAAHVQAAQEILLPSQCCVIL